MVKKKKDPKIRLRSTTIAKTALPFRNALEQH